MVSVGEGELYFAHVLGAHLSCEFPGLQKVIFGDV